MHFSLKYLVLSISPLDNDSLVILREVLQSTDRTSVVMVQLKYYLVLAYRQNPLRLPHLRKYLHLGVIFHLDHFLMIYSCFCIIVAAAPYLRDFDCTDRMATYQRASIHFHRGHLVNDE